MSSKLIGNYDLLSNLENNDVFGSKAISGIQSFDAALLSGVISSGEGRPDLFVGSNINDFGYLLFANPKASWTIQGYYNYYPSEAVLLSRISFPDI